MAAAINPQVSSGASGRKVGAKCVSLYTHTQNIIMTMNKEKVYIHIYVCIVDNGNEVDSSVKSS